MRWDVIDSLQRRPGSVGESTQKGLGAKHRWERTSLLLLGVGHCVSRRLGGGAGQPWGKRQRRETPNTSNTNRTAYGALTQEIVGHSCVKGTFRKNRPVTLLLFSAVHVSA